MSELFSFYYQLMIKLSLKKVKVHVLSNTIIQKLINHGFTILYHSIMFGFLYDFTIIGNYINLSSFETTEQYWQIGQNEMPFKWKYYRASWQYRSLSTVCAGAKISFVFCVKLCPFYCVQHLVGVVESWHSYDL